MERKTLPTPAKATDQEIIEIYEALPRADQKALYTFVLLLWEAEGTEAAKKVCSFSDHVIRTGGNARAALDIMIAALQGNKDAMGVVEATLEEAGA